MAGGNIWVRSYTKPTATSRNFLQLLSLFLTANLLCLIKLLFIQHPEASSMIPARLWEMMGQRILSCLSGNSLEISPMKSIQQENQKLWRGRKKKGGLIGNEKIILLKKKIT